MKKFLAAVALIGFLSVPAMANPWTVTAVTEVTAATTEANSNILGTFTNFIRLTLEGHTGFVAFSGTPYSGALSIYMPNSDPQIFKVPGNAIIGVSTDEGTGRLYIEELSR